MPWDRGAGFNPLGAVANGTVAASENVMIGYQPGTIDSTDPSKFTAIGTSAVAGASGTAIGSATKAGTNATAIGRGAIATGKGSMALGMDSTNVPATTTVDDEIKLGTPAHTTKIAGRLNVAQRTPTSGADTQGQVGDVMSDANYVYVKTSTGWKRSPLTSW